MGRWWRRLRAGLPVRLSPVDQLTCALRRGLERDLNDGPAQRVAALAVELGLMSVNLADPVLNARIAAVQGALDSILEELRDIGSALYPPVLAGGGLEEALCAVAERYGVAVVVDSALIDPGEMAAACLAVADRLRSVPPGSRVGVRVRRGVGTVRVHVTTEPSDA
jgi:Histidine kinase